METKVFRRRAAADRSSALVGGAVGSAPPLRSEAPPPELGHLRNKRVVATGEPQHGVLQLSVLGHVRSARSAAAVNVALLSLRSGRMQAEEGLLQLREGVGALSPQSLGAFTRLEFNGDGIEDEELAEPGDVGKSDPDGLL